MSKALIRQLPGFFVGVPVGAFFMWRAASFMIEQEFSSLAAAGNATWDNIRVEMIDTVFMMGLLLLPLTFFLLLAAVGVSLFQNRMGGTKG
ncbi:hypothetical protein KBD18_01315 [Patescibacteria group bacterium]|nr:hypothetical protein [Patescibacteria group bacterium]